MDPVAEVDEGKTAELTAVDEVGRTWPDEVGKGAETLDALNLVAVTREKEVVMTVPKGARATTVKMEPSPPMELPV